MTKRRSLTLLTSQVWSFIRFLELLAFLAGMLIAGSVMSSMQQNIAPARQANTIFNHAHDVNLGKKFVVHEVNLGGPEAVMYIFACQDSPGNTECDIKTCNGGSNLRICVCEIKGEDEELKGCQTESFTSPVKGYVKVEGSSRIRIEKTEIEDENVIYIQEVVS